MPIARRVAPMLTLTLSCLVVGGCGMAYRPYYDEGGSGASIDEFVYVSRPHSPKTVALIDTRTGETLWSTDVPVGKQLAIRFYKDEAPDNTYTPDMMRWGIFEAGTRWGKKPNEMLVPPDNARRLEMDVRPQPEFPPREQPAPNQPYVAPPTAKPRATQPVAPEHTPASPPPAEPMTSEPASMPPGVREVPPSNPG